MLYTPTTRVIVARVARAWSRRINWVDCADIEQHVWVEVLQACSGYMRDRGSVEAFVTTIAKRSAARFCAENSVPVTGSVRETMYRLRLVSCVVTALDADDAPELPAQLQPTDKQLHKLRMGRAIRSRLVEVLGTDDTALLLLAQQFPPREIAAHLSCQTRTVSDRIWRLKQRCADDLPLRVLWSQL